MGDMKIDDDNEDHKREEECDGGYETCEEAYACESSEFTAAMLRDARQMSSRVQDAEAASMILALCQQLEVQEEQNKNLKKRCDSIKQKLRDARSQLHAQHNLQGQNSRYWWKVQVLRKQLSRTHMLLHKQASRSRQMQWRGGYGQAHFPP